METILQTLFDEIDCSQIHENQKKCQEQILQTFLYLVQRPKLVRECRGRTKLIKSISRFVELNWSKFENKPALYAALSRLLRDWTEAPFFRNTADVRAQFLGSILVDQLDREFLVHLSSLDISKEKQLSQVFFIECIFERYS